MLVTAAAIMRLICEPPPKASLPKIRIVINSSPTKVTIGISDSHTGGRLGVDCFVGFDVAFSVIIFSLILLFVRLIM